MDRLDPDSFMITINFVAKFAEQIANTSVNAIPRKLADSVVKKMEERKKFMPSADKEEKKEEKKETKKRTRKSKKAEA